MVFAGVLDPSVWRSSALLTPKCPLMLAARIIYLFAQSSMRGRQRRGRGGRENVCKRG